LDVLVVPLGGGGLMAGSATVAKAYTSETYVVGVEPAMGDDTRRSLAAGERVVIPVPRTIADGLQAATPGELTFEVNRRLVDEVVTVSDEEIVEAMRFLFERMKLVVEPSGAVAVAALLSRRLRGGGGRRVGALISGGNVSAERFSTLLRG
jgi:threonine dehydratase